MRCFLALTVCFLSLSSSLIAEETELSVNSEQGQPSGISDQSEISADSEAVEIPSSSPTTTLKEPTEPEFINYELTEPGCDSPCDGSLINSANCCREPQFNISGWIDAGFIGNTDSPASKFNGPYNAVDRSNEAMMNQLYIIAERELPCCGNGLGFRLDLLYGEDYLLAESAGFERNPDGSNRWNNEFYGLAFPQAFVSLGNKDLSIQVGHFYSVVGYEGIMSPDNFFYSKAYSYQFAGPFTHWGGQVNARLGDSLTVQAGLHNGWDALDQTSDHVGFVGKVKYEDQESGVWTSFAITSGQDSNNLAALPITTDFTNRTRYSWILNLPLSCKIDYVFHHWLGVQERGAIGGGRADWYGIDQYLYYTINKCWKAGFRFEWFRDQNGTRVGLNRTSNPNTPQFIGNFYSLTFGVNWTPIEDIILRPEIRADWYDGNAARQPFQDGRKSSQLMLGFDAIYMF